ncbi:hypothetical protein L598_003800000020 [Mesorhizobium sp. J18]|uniref:DUF6065 family protein n=1 Tax=Mesorhizobium sp. J18 TaxID=935263 RepID=UPI00119B9987|nr:DUF6065 family protein [Mesorhizobium sp. J18]TWG94159.1 hypothetical protein L598_003800000020 [Mesorhizobium sp. J18]
MKGLTAYVVDGHELRIRPAPVEREWMDDTDQRFAYRCLPLNIANAHGWEILCTTAFSAIWDGRQSLDAVRVRTRPANASPQAISHFGSGTLTFHIPCLFRTEPGIDLFVTGPLNRPKDGIAPLSGIVETDWSPYTFTMNWKFTRPNQRVHFEMDEPFCHIFPIGRGSLETVTPTIRKLSELPDLEQEFKTWSESRNEFNADLSDPASKAVQDKWQKAYFRGVHPTGAQGPEDHRSRLRLRPFKTT